MNIEQSYQLFVSLINKVFILDSGKSPLIRIEDKKEIEKRELIKQVILLYLYSHKNKKNSVSILELQEEIEDKVIITITDEFFNETMDKLRKEGFIKVPVSFEVALTPKGNLYCEEMRRGLDEWALHGDDFTEEEIKKIRGEAFMMVSKSNKGRIKRFTKIMMDVNDSFVSEGNDIRLKSKKKRSRVFNMMLEDKELEKPEK